MIELYSSEIHDILNRYNNHIPSDVYLNICNTSPQLNHIKYNPYGDYFEAWDRNGEYFKFTVYRKDG